MQWQPGSYTRMSYFLKPNNHIQMVNQEGEMRFVRIESQEPLGMMPLKFAGPLTLPAANTNLAAGASIENIITEFLEPGRTMRLFQVRPCFIIEDSESGRKEISLLNVFAGLENLIADISLFVEHPTGNKRYGTDIQQTINVNGLVQTVGGVNRGSINAISIPFVDDMNELFDMWCYWGQYPSFKITNETLMALGAENIIWPVDPPIIHNFNYYLGFTGMKYLLAPISDIEKELLESYDFKAIGVTIGGMEVRTTKI